MNDTGNLPIWDLNPASVLIAALVLIVFAVCILAYYSDKK